jgi:phenylalanine-4-hydroxylase
MRTLYRIDDFQETYFVIDSFDELLALADIDFEPIYQRVVTMPDLEPGTIAPDDTVLHRGTGTYHEARRTVA